MIHGPTCEVFLFSKFCSEGCFQDHYWAPVTFQLQFVCSNIPRDVFVRSLWGSSFSLQLIKFTLVEFWHSSASKIFWLHFWEPGMWSFSWFLHCFGQIWLLKLRLTTQPFLFVPKISNRNPLFFMFVFNGIIRSYMSVTSLFSMIAFGSCSHEFPETGNLILADASVDYSTYFVVPLCMQLFWDEIFLHPERRWLVLSVCILQNGHLSAWLSLAIS